MAPIRSGARLASLAAVIAVFAGCSPKPKETPAPAQPTAPPAVSIPVPPPTVGRAELLAAVSKAASAFAAGQAMPKDVTDLTGRRFSVRLPFGCLGPQDGEAARYAYDAQKGSLKLTARAETWTDVGSIRALVATPATEAIEGFWFPRPWIAAEACPALRPQPVPVVQPEIETRAAKTAGANPAPVPAPFPHTVGLVSTFEAGDSRLQRRGTRPYEVVRKADAAPNGAFRLLLEGRIVEGEGGPVVCRSDDPDRPPTCLVRVEFDRVAIEGAAGEVFGEWR